MYHTINAASNALDNSSVFEMFDFDEIHYDCVVGYMWAYNKTPLEAACYFGVMGDDTSLIPTRKDDNWKDGTTTIWFEDVSTNDGEILGVVFDGNSYAMSVDVNGEAVDNPAILGSILEAARIVACESDIAAKLAERDIEITTLKYRNAQLQLMANSSYGSSTGCREQLLTEALQALLNMDVNGHALQDRLQFSDKGRALLEQARTALGVAL